MCLFFSIQVIFIKEPFKSTSVFYNLTHHFLLKCLKVGICSSQQVPIVVYSVYMLTFPHNPHTKRYTIFTIDINHRRLSVLPQATYKGTFRYFVFSWFLVIFFNGSNYAREDKILIFQQRHKSLVFCVGSQGVN